MQSSRSASPSATLGQLLAARKGARDTSTARHDFRTRVRIRRGDAVGLQFSVGAYGSAPYSDGTSLERWSPPLGPERRPSDSGGAQTYELLYNAIVERDRDGDGYGDVTQDRCPRDPRRHAGC